MSWWKTAKEGDKIVCINNDPYFIDKTIHDCHDPLDGLELNKIYTVYEIFEQDFEICVSLQEIERPLWDFGNGDEEIGYSVLRFKPVEKQKTDISVFTSMLNDDNVSISEAKELENV